MAEMIFARRLERLPIGEWYQKQSVGRLISDGTGRRALALRHPDPLVEALRFAICEGELLQAVGRGRGVRRNAETPLEVLILTDVPLPIPVDTLITWKGLCDAGPLDVLEANGVIPLDYMGIVAALPGRFENETQLKDWFQKRPEARSKLKAVKRTARDLGTVDLCEFSDISHRESNMGKVAKLAAYRYRRAGSRQRSLVLVNDAMHADARAAVEAAVGPVTHFAAVEHVLGRRPRRQASSMDTVSQSLLDRLFGLESPEINGLRPFGRLAVDGQDRQ